MTKTERQQNRLTDRILKAAKRGDEDAILTAIENLLELGRRDGMDALAIDLHDAELLTDEAALFAITNNGVTDPRR